MMTMTDLPDAANRDSHENVPRPTCVFTASLMYRLAAECGWRAPTAGVVAEAPTSGCRRPE
jgi:hypothetical protein